jgi:hypothetical protein
MATRYNIYYAGQLLDGERLEAVRPRLAKLFNADEQTLDRLFSGKAQLLKRDCDKATALKYKQAMEKAGALPLIRASEGDGTSAKAVTPARPAEQARDQGMTAAERIAALAAAAEAREAGRQPPPPGDAPPARAEETETGGVSLAPVGADVLREEERSVTASAVIDTAGLDLGEQGQRLSPEPPRAPPAPDTSHLEMGAIGEAIPTLPRHEAELSPDIDGLELSPSGTDFADCAAPPAEAPQLDLSALDLAPAGSDVLEEGYRKRTPPEAPATDHLSLEE